MTVLCTVVLLSIVRSLEATLTQESVLGPFRPMNKMLRPVVSAAQIRDELELAREREQILAAKTSIADWRESLRKHGRTQPGGDQQEKLTPAVPGKSEGKNGTAPLEPGTDPDDVDDVEASVVCYGPLGCFHETDHLPEMLPSSPAEVNTRFLVYTTTHRSEKPLIEFSYEELVVAGFGAAYWSNGTNDTVSIPMSGGMSSSLLKTFGDLSDRTVRVIVHGFGANCGLVWIYEMRTALMAVENCTVICVDWENGAKLPNYVRAAANTRLVGRQLALLLRLLRTHNDLRLSRVHLIGFSLGSHVAGFAGAEFSTGATAPLKSTGLWRITGLDPAGPLFEAQPPEVRLDASDARYVDVIHSNGENLILGGLGSWQPMGTVDYYPNGGRVQHGCTNLFVGAVTDIIWAPPTTVEGRSLCNHRRAYKFFIDSVAPRCHFPAFPCESYDKFATGECFECGPGGRRNGTSASACGHMGYYATSREVGGYGQLYLRTRDEEPYCANQFRLRLRNAPDELPLRTVGRFELTLEGGDTGNGIGDGVGSGDERSTAALITFNETFHLDEAREDREFHAGQWLTTILVPHPALGHRPRALTITYRPYRGGWWQRSSVGKQLWRIGPILLTADDQKTYGSCDTLTLQADVPVRLELAHVQLTPKDARGKRGADGTDDADDDDDEVGDCRVIEPEARRPLIPVGKQVEPQEPSERSVAIGSGKSSIDELVQPGRHDHFSWTPVAISIPRQPHADRSHLQHQQQPHMNEKRSFSESSLHSDDPSAAQSPLMNGQLSQARDAAVNLPLDGTAPATTGPGGGGTQTVQLFPSSNVTVAPFSDPSTGLTGGLVDEPTTTTTTTTVTSTTTTSVVELLSPVAVARKSTGSSSAATSEAVTESARSPSTESPPSSSTEIRIALPTFRPLARSAESLVGSGRQHYTRFIPLVYENDKLNPAVATRPLPAARMHKGATAEAS
ncbi:AGAP000309-PA-like protein [Anopheles sinensis]|uniref:AGAP000309-PA-like protein n=1 Tax=Anopheles sinensis TaxID=74873 RepID=A0A084VNX7_ANOSI|nr:AGAP000309-PA-like protein [Anopheles sinensis]